MTDTDKFKDYKNKLLNFYMNILNNEIQKQNISQDYDKIIEFKKLLECWITENYNIYDVLQIFIETSFEIYDIHRLNKHKKLLKIIIEEILVYPCENNSNRLSTGSQLDEIFYKLFYYTSEEHDVNGYNFKQYVDDFYIRAWWIHMLSSYVPSFFDLNLQHGQIKGINWMDIETAKTQNYHTKNVGEFHAWCWTYLIYVL
jgi:hypothetical protein